LVEANLFSAEFVLRSASNLCKVYLSINDSVEPSDVEIYRAVNSSDLTFILADPSNVTSFEIFDSRLNFTDSPTNTDINIQYTFGLNNFSTIISKNVFFGKILI